MEALQKSGNNLRRGSSAVNSKPNNNKKRDFIHFRLLLISFSKLPFHSSPVSVFLCSSLGNPLCRLQPCLNRYAGRSMDTKPKWNHDMHLRFEDRAGTNLSQISHPWMNITLAYRGWRSQRYRSLHRHILLPVAQFAVHTSLMLSLTNTISISKKKYVSLNQDEQKTLGVSLSLLFFVKDAGFSRAFWWQ